MEGFLLKTLFLEIQLSLWKQIVNKKLNNPKKRSKLSMLSIIDTFPRSCGSTSNPAFFHTWTFTFPFNLHFVWTWSWSNFNIFLFLWSVIHEFCICAKTCLCCTLIHLFFLWNFVEVYVIWWTRWITGRTRSWWSLF